MGKKWGQGGVDSKFEDGWVVNTDAIRKAGLDSDGEPVITVLVHSPGQGKDGRAHGSSKATFQRWNSGTAILSGELPEGVEFDIAS